MTTPALVLILFSALIHATWNLMAKKSSSGRPFIWLCSLISVLLYAPLALWVALRQSNTIDIAAIAVLSVTSLLHLAYFICLQTGYAKGDFSLVYPIARGTGPLLSTIAAIAIFGERPSAPAFAGMCLIVTGVFILSCRPESAAAKNARTAVTFGLITGFLIAAYTIWDTFAVTTAGLSPVLVDYVATVGMLLILTPYVLANREKISREWKENRKEAVAVGALSPLAFMIVLWVLVTTPVSYVAPLREISILFAAVMGSKLLEEGQVMRRLAASGIMFVGVITLAVC